MESILRPWSERLCANAPWTCDHIWLVDYADEILLGALALIAIFALSGRARVARRLRELRNQSSAAAKTIEELSAQVKSLASLLERLDQKTERIVVDHETRDRMEQILSLWRDAKDFVQTQVQRISDPALRKSFSEMPKSNCAAIVERLVADAGVRADRYALGPANLERFRELDLLARRVAAQPTHADTKNLAAMKRLVEEFMTVDGAAPAPKPNGARSSASGFFGFGRRAPG